MEQVPSSYLRQAAATASVRAIKQRAYALLGLFPGASVLDIGCGPGISTPDLARLVGPFGQVWGVDRDPAMVSEAEQAAQGAGVAAWTIHRVADAASLPFADATFHACFSDRVLQHVAPDEAARCVAEAVRVLCHGGVAVFVDSDWGSFSVDAPPKLERRIQQLHMQRFHNPFSGRRLGRMMREAGLSFVGVEPVAVPMSAAQAVNLLAPTERAARQAGTLDEAEVEVWRVAAAGWPPGATVGHLTMVIAAGRRD